MTSALRFGLFCVFVFSLTIPALARMRQGPPVVLFDGTTTSGWSKAGQQPHDGWVVQDGALYRKSGGGDLYHSGTYRDFILHFQWKISRGGNSGLKYRVRKYGNQWLGCEYQILDDVNAREKNKSASLYDIHGGSGAKPVATPDVWHSGKIVVCGNHIEHWMDGVQVLQTNTASQDWQERVAASKFRDRENFGENREGRIFLQDHGNPVWFRQIVLVPLDCDARPLLTTAPHSAPGCCQIPAGGVTGCQTRDCRPWCGRPAGRGPVATPRCRRRFFLRAR